MPEVSAESSGAPSLRPSSLVGRAEELEQLVRHLVDGWATGSARTLSISGVNGIGKTRLVEVALEAARRQRPEARTVWASARRSGRSHGLIGRLLRERFQLDEGAPPSHAREKIRGEVGRVLGHHRVEDVCFFLGQLLGLAFPGSPLTQVVADSPEEARQLRRAVVKRFFEADAARTPLAMVFDDVDEADSDSLDLLQYLFDALKGPLALIACGKPELFSRLNGELDPERPSHLHLELRALSEAAARQLVEQLLPAAEGSSPEPLIKAAVEVGQGNPGGLYAMAQTYLDTGVLQPVGEGEGTWKIDLEQLANVRLPQTVEDAVAVRLGALTAAQRRVLEHAAVMGMVFWRGGLIALGRLDREPPRSWKIAEESDVAALDTLLAELAARDHILKLPDASFEGEEEWMFRSPREHGVLLAELRAPTLAHYHRGVADWLAVMSDARVLEESLSLLAQHLEASGAPERAGQSYLQAADRARAQHALKQAETYYARGLALTREADPRQRLGALHNQGDVLLQLGRTEEALAAFQEMLGLAHRLGLRDKGGAAENRIGRLYRETGALAEAQQHLAAGLALFELAGDTRGIAASHDDIGKLAWLRGDYEEALTEQLRGLELRKTIGDRRSIALSLNNIGLTWLDHGRPRQAREALEAALLLRREVRDQLGVIQTLDSLGRLATDQRDLDRALTLFQEAYQSSLELGDKNRTAVVLTHLGQTHYRRNDPLLARELLSEALLLCQEQGNRLYQAIALRGLAKTYLLTGELKPARRHAREAMQLFAEVRSRVHLAAALRTLGEITAAGAWGPGHSGKAVDYFMRSVALCKEIGNELETAKSYRAFARYVKSERDYADNEDIQREAATLDAMAQEIFDRRQLSKPSAPAQ